MLAVWSQSGIMQQVVGWLHFGLNLSGQHKVISNCTEGHKADQAITGSQLWTNPYKISDVFDWGILTSNHHQLILRHFPKISLSVFPYPLHSFTCRFPWSTMLFIQLPQ